MHDEEQVRRYRAMMPAERWELWRELTAFGFGLWEANLDEAEIERRMRVWRREHDLSDQNMLRAAPPAEAPPLARRPRRSLRAPKRI